MDRIYHLVEWRLYECTGTHIRVYVWFEARMQSMAADHMCAFVTINWCVQIQPEFV